VKYHRESIFLKHPTADRLRMRIIFPVWFILMMISSPALSQNTLEIEISGLRNDKGLIMLQFFDENHNLITQEKGVIIERKSIIIIRNIATAKYAVHYFHDENLNGILETNKIGKPTEGYGFSNDAYGTFGPRPFENWLFEVKENQKILLRTRY
jgi:uncharacterized protein (DUF2141 family)